MTDTTFVDQTTVIEADWLNDVNDATYTAVPQNTAAIAAHIADATAAHAASAIANTPAGNVAATDVQAAINELDTEKAALAGSASQVFSVAAATSDDNAVRKDQINVANSPLVATALNASGSAPIFACRAWVNFNGTGTVAIRGSGNVSSITDNGTGTYVINLMTAMPDTNGVILDGKSNQTSNAGNATGSAWTSTSTISVVVYENNSLVDVANLYFAVFR